MKAKTVAERAAELGTDQEELIRALKVLCRWQLKNDGWTTSRNGGYWYRRKKPIMSLEQAAAMLGVDPKDADKQIKVSHAWTVTLVVDGLVAFLKKEGRWPINRELRRSNNLPSPWKMRRLARRAMPWNAGISIRGWWERRVAADPRCGPMMAVTLRNVLARKEAIDRIGFQTFIKKGIAEVINSHPEYGTLYRLPGEIPAEPMILLKVVNSTPEPDGSFSDYFLRVPPDQTDVREALKWTFNGNQALGNQPYEPLVET